MFFAPPSPVPLPGPVLPPAVPAWLDSAPGLLLDRAAVEPRPPAAATAGPVLTVLMLDGFQIRIDERPLACLPRGKIRSLFKLLVLQRHRPVARARLCAQLWPELDAAGARNNLNVSLHRLRRQLGPGAAIVHEGEGYRLRGSGELWLDTEAFGSQAAWGLAEAARGAAGAAIASLEAAAALYRSDLDDDAEPETAPALAAQALALRDQFNQVLECLGALHEAAGDWHAGLRVALRQLALDPCDEAANQRRMRCHARLGQLQALERQYRLCVGALRSQFGLGPSEATTALYRRLAGRCAS